MRVFTAPALPPGYGEVGVTIGNFDGVHLGHQALVLRMQEKARAHGCKGMVITFWPHPLHVVAPHKAPPLLYTREQRLALLDALGVDTVLELPFDRSFAALTPEDFARRVLAPVGCRELVIGYDFSLGKGRSGNFAVLQELGERYGFGVERIEPVLVRNRVVSASRIREVLREGRVQNIPTLMGRWYGFNAPLSSGFGRGAGMGVPTLNMRPQTTMLPRNGVYASFVEANGHIWPAVTNVGMNPTFHNKHLTVESHLLDATICPDGTPPTVYFVQRLRGEQRFASSEALVAQIRDDITQARGILAAVAPPRPNAAGSPG